MNLSLKYLKTTLLLLLPLICAAQNTKKYRVKFNSIDTPTLIIGSFGNYKLKTPSNKLNALFNRHKIIDFKKVFPSSETPKLKLIYVIQADTSLIIELKKNAPELTIKKEPEEETLLENTTSYLSPQLSLPNDYGLALPQANLDLINANEAWQYTTGNSNFRLGITDTPFDIGHTELVTKIFMAPTSTAFYNYSNQSHGTSMAGIMAGKTNNGISLASIGYNCTIEADWMNLDACNAMSKRGIRVISNSWRHSGNIPDPDDQGIIDEMYDRGTILVFAAGNDNNSGLIYPAANNHVISVASIGSSNTTDGIDTTYTDSHEMYAGFKPSRPLNETNILRSQSHNKEVDILAPGYLVPNIWDRNINTLSNGSSAAAPHVAGTIGLMFSVNSSLKPLEVETILKLTAANIEQLPRNVQYAGMLGAGRLDAGKAVKMAFNLINQDTIEIANKDIYRWPLKIGGQGSTAPFAIKVNKEIFRDSVNADFTARKCIIITNSTLKPDLKGSVNFTVNAYSVNYYNNLLPVYANATTPNNILERFPISNDAIILNPKLTVYPIPAYNIITIATGINNVSQIKIFNLNGVAVKTFQTDGKGIAKTDISNLTSGYYIIQSTQNNKIITSKIIVSK